MMELDVCKEDTRDRIQTNDPNNLDGIHGDTASLEVIGWVQNPLNKCSTFQGLGNQNTEQEEF